MNLKSLIFAAFAAALSCTQAYGQATILPPGETCFSALAPTSGGPGNTGTGFLGLLGSITGGSGYTNGTYGGVALTGGSGTGATANITVSGAVVTQVTILSPGLNYVVGDVLSATAASIGGSGAGFSVPVSSVAINYALAGGSIGFFVPNTQTIKQTWQDSGETILNQNPVPLDANGCAVIYGAGIYRSVLKDSLGNTVWDKLTASTGPSGVFWAGTAGGTGNAITVADTQFALQDGATIQFRALNANTGPTTLTASANAAIAIVKDTSAGPAALSGGEIGVGNTPIVTYDLPNNQFHIINPSATSSSTTSTSLVTPQGYLNLVGQATGDVIQTGDVIGTTSLFYSPFTGSLVPVWNGTAFVNIQFSELVMSMTAAGSPANTIQDACVFNNNGVPTMVLGPSWSTVTAGAGNRGTGAGTAQLTRLQGIWVNAVSMIGYNGLSSYTIAANQCTYVGSVSIDAAAGQTSAYRSYGQSRKWGVWNAYNRQPIVIQVGDSTASWNYAASVTTRPANVNANNSMTVFAGLPEEPVYATENQRILVNATGTTSTNGAGFVGIGLNSTSSFGASIVAAVNGGLTISGVSVAPTLSTQAITELNVAPFIGINTLTALEATSITSAQVTYFGTFSNMLLRAAYRG